MLFNRFTEIVVKAFGSDHRFMTSRDKAYKLVVNDTSVFRLDLLSSRTRSVEGGREGGGRETVGVYQGVLTFQKSQLSHPHFHFSQSWSHHENPSRVQVSRVAGQLL